MSRKIFILAAFLLLTYGLAAALKISAGNGSWTSGSTWSPSGVPVCGDSIVILGIHTVSITAQTDYTGCSSIVIVIRGVLYFTGGNKLRLPCGAKMYFMPGGSLNSDGAGNSNQLTVCGTTEWSGTQGQVNGPTCIPSTMPGCINVLLSVKLSHFSAQICSDLVCLRWQTMREQDNHRFEIERSLNGYEFLTIKTLRSKAAGGNSMQSLNYETTDEALSGEVVYYRLKQVDFDQTVNYSDIVAVYKESVFISGITVYPNPSTGIFNIQVRGQNSSVHLTYMVLNTLGEPILHGDGIVQSGSDILTVGNDEKLKQGTYLLQLNAGERIYRNKLIIQ